MVHEGRIIDGHVECAEVFDLSLTRNEEGKETERLSDVVVHYTASTRSETVSAARSLSIALGLAASEATTIGRADQQQFQWNVDHELVSLDLRWTRLGDNWNLYLSSAHYQQ